jgi:amino acid adenylation domain-containing protein
VSGLETFLATVRGLGVKLWVEGDKLKMRASEGVLSPELTDALKERKAEILALLRPEPVYSIAPLPPQEHYELSAAQRRLWVLAQLPGASAAYNIPLHQFLEGPLDRAALETAFAGLVERHDSLRTIFVSVDGMPRQVVHARLQVPIEFEDVGGLENAEHVARQLGREEASKPFDLAAGPLLRVRLLKLAEAQHVLLFTIHHIIADGVSLGVLARDLSRLYECARSGRPHGLPVLAFGYPAFADWHNRLLSGELMAPHRKYWLRSLAGELPVLNLPTDHPRPPVQGYRGRELFFTSGSEQLKALDAFCRKRNATLFMALHAALKVLLFAYTGQDDIIIGCAVAGREHADLADQVGLYLNMLALRSRIWAEASFEEFFGEVAQLTKESFDHQIYQFDQLVGELNVPRDLSRFPLVDVMLIEQNQDEPGLGLDGLRARPVFEHTETSKFDLTFYFKAVPTAGLLLGIEYNTDLFCEDRIRRMGGHFLELIDSILVNPSEPVGRLNVLPKRERGQLLDAFNRTTSSYPRDRTVLDLLEAAATETPDAVALVCGRRHLTYRELHARSNQLAWHLQGLGIGPETTVGICVERSPELVIGLLGILKAGGTYVPLDPRYPADRLAYIVDDAPVSVLIKREGSQNILRCRPSKWVDLDTDWSQIAQCPSDAPPRQIESEHLAYIIYTSGSTGRPKGVEIPHRALVNFLVAMADRPGLARHDVLLAVTTISFDIAALEIYLPLLRNARLVLAEDADIADGARLTARLHDSGATVMQATPSTWQLLLAAGWQGNPALKVICGGEALRGWLGEQLLARAGSVWNMYGPTETTVWSTSRKLDRNDGVRRDAVETIGRPIANTEVYILDRQLRPVPVGVPGDLYIGGEGLAAGYRNLAELTAEKFFAHPFNRDRRVYKTGDIARYRDNGDIEYLGRTDHQVKLRGFRIELGEIEAALAAHPDIQHAVVDAREDAAGDKRLIGWYVSSHGRELPAAALREYLQRKLADYMIPALFVRVAALPMTPNGKVDRKVLTEPDQAYSRTAAYEAPRTKWEETLARLWQDVLNISSVGIHDNFFELGGHSLKATAFIARLQTETGVHLNLVDVFRYPSVATLAAHLVTNGGGSPTIVGPAATASAKIPPNPDGASTDEARRHVIRPATAEELELLNRP